jgi:hypothetical protein
MSVSLAAKPGSPERLKVRGRCDCSLCSTPDALRYTEPSEMPMALAIARPVQWVAWYRGSVQVSATARRFRIARSSTGHTSATIADSLIWLSTKVEPILCIDGETYSP